MTTVTRQPRSPASRELERAEPYLGSVANGCWMGARARLCARRCVTRLKAKAVIMPRAHVPRAVSRLYALSSCASAVLKSATAVLGKSFLVLPLQLLFLGPPWIFSRSSGIAPVTGRGRRR